MSQDFNRFHFQAIYEFCASAGAYPDSRFYIPEFLFRSVFPLTINIEKSTDYHAPRVPDIPGLAEWKEAWPSRIQHSKSYRNPNGFEDQVIGLKLKFLPELMTP